MGLDAESYQVVKADVFQNRWHPPSEVAMPLFIVDIREPILNRVASCLAQAYPAGHETHWIQPNDLGPSKSLAISSLAAGNLPEGNPILLVPALAEEASIQSLANVLARLRAPEGCPWDREQTLETMRIQILSEVHEVIEAIDLRDDENLKEELGDLIMDALFMVHIALTDGKFQLADVMAEICQKMVRRHPHVYGDVDLADSETVLTQWDAIKKAEKGAKDQDLHPFDGIPKGLPALEAAREMQSKAKKNGLECPVLAVSPAGQIVGSWTEETLGQQLWDLVRAAADDGVNAELALQRQNSLLRQHHRRQPNQP